MEEGRVPIPVSEAVTEVVDETETLCSSMRMGQIQYICNPVPYTDHAQQEQDDERLTKVHIRDFVNLGAPEAHIEQRSFLINTGCHAGTTTHSSLQLQHGHIPGAVERFKSSQQPNLMHMSMYSWHALRVLIHSKCGNCLSGTNASLVSHLRIVQDFHRVQMQ